MVQTLTISELKRQAGEEPLVAHVVVQLQALLQRSTKQGKPYYEVQLADSAGRVSIKVWSDSAAYDELGKVAVQSVIGLEAWWTQGGFGIEARDLRLVVASDDEVEAFFAGDPVLRERQEQDMAWMESVCSTLVDPRLRSLAGRFFERFRGLMKRTAAARRNHHARRGGLVEHTAQMMRAAEALCGVYAELNRDLLLCGVLFHDVGKLWENSYPERGFAQHHSLRGEMLGHIPMGIELVNHLWREVMDGGEADWGGLQPAADETRLHLLHLVASHHGELEYGSPVLPRTPEAIALHYIDNLDARLEMLREAYAHSQQVAPGIYERVFPLSCNLVKPLEPCCGEVLMTDAPD